MAEDTPLSKDQQTEFRVAMEAYCTQNDDS